MLLFAAALSMVQPQSQPLPQTQCAAMDVNLPAPLAGWTSGGGIPLQIGKFTVVMPMPASAIPGLPASAKPGNAVAVPFSVDTPGVYGIALNQPGWIDVAPRGGAPLTAVKQGHGPECSTIRKIVRFGLQPGNYTIYVSGVNDINVKVMLVAPE